MQRKQKDHQFDLNVSADFAQEYDDPSNFFHYLLKKLKIFFDYLEVIEHSVFGKFHRNDVHPNVFGSRTKNARLSQLLNLTLLPDNAPPNFNGNEIYSLHSLLFGAYMLITMFIKQSQDNLLDNYDIWVDCFIKQSKELSDRIPDNVKNNINKISDFLEKSKAPVNLVVNHFKKAKFTKFEPKQDIHKNPKQYLN